MDITIGRTSEGLPVRLPIERAPHILVAGMTGSGKSTWIHAILSELLGRYRNNEVALLLIDPKRVELARYNGDSRVIYGHSIWGDDITRALEWAVGEMHGRYALMERARQTHYGGRWPLDLIVIDELANVILADKKSEKLIVQLASMGRAAGMHLILATQRPSADVVTGLIRANVPTRICMPVVSRMESRIILDAPGAEALINPGEMLVRLPGHRDLMWLQGGGR